jgi:hypothetical protein
VRIKLAALSAIAACVALSAAAPALASSPSGAGAASPATVARGSSTLLTVTVVPGAAPASTGVYVSCNLSALGSSFSQLFADDGTGGDAHAGDLVFSYRLVVPSAAGLGPYVLPCVISDAQGRSALASIALTVDVAANLPPTAGAGGPYVVDEGSPVTVTATGVDPEGGALTYAWDIDNDGTFETAGQSATFTPEDGPAVRTVAVQVTDPGGLTATDSATVTVANVAPTAQLHAPASAGVGASFQISLVSPSDPSAADTAAGFTYSFDCGSGYGPWSASSAATCSAGSAGTLHVGGQIRDKDGGVSEYGANVQVSIGFDGLCALTRSLSHRPKVADGLCKELGKAERARKPSARHRHLRVYRKRVRSHTGMQRMKAFTPDDGALLQRLSRLLG